MHTLQRVAIVAIAGLISVAGSKAQAQFGIALNADSGSLELFYDINAAAARLPDPTYDLHTRAMNRAAAQDVIISEEFSKGNSVPSNSFRDNLRGESRYGIASRDTASRRAVNPNTAPAPRTATAPSAPPPIPVPSLADFLNREGRMDWPLDASYSGDLAQLRNEADRELVAALRELQRSGKASVGAITSARAKLVVYGQGALQEIRLHRSTQIANGFHAFLMAVYLSLEGTEKTP